jgi:general stress protein YciG
MSLSEMLAIMNNKILPEPSKRGFAAMNLEQQRLIASKGGKAAHQKGTAHEWTPEEAREAARKSALAAKRKSINRTENDGCDHFCSDYFQMALPATTDGRGSIVFSQSFLKRTETVRFIFYDRLVVLSVTVVS